MSKETNILEKELVETIFERELPPEVVASVFLIKVLSTFIKLDTFVIQAIDLLLYTPVIVPVVMFYVSIFLKPLKKFVKYGTVVVLMIINLLLVKDIRVLFVWTVFIVLCLIVEILKQLYKLSDIDRLIIHLLSTLLLLIICIK